MIKWFVIFSFSLGSTAFASFSETSKRYLSPKDMFTLLSQKFPVINDPGIIQKLEASCWALGHKNGNVTGLVIPAIGVPATVKPGPGFVRWWGSCAERISSLQMNELANKPADEKLWRRFWASDLLDNFRDPSKQSEPYHKMQTVQWKGLSDKVKDAQIRFLIEEFVGPNAVVKDLGFVKGSDELAGILKSALVLSPQLTLAEANAKLMLALLLREEFMTY